MKKIGFAVLLPILFFSFNGYAADSKIEDYAFQERCRKNAYEYFITQVGYEATVDKATVSSDYQNHYNKKMNKCFILINSNLYPPGSPSEVLIDVNENKKYGTIRLQAIYVKDEPDELKMQTCYVLDKHCKSPEEWKLLIKKYMEE